MSLWGPQVVTVNGTTAQQIPDWANDLSRQIAEGAFSLGQDPYQPFPGARIEDFGQDQLNAFDIIRQSQGLGSVLNQEAIDSIRASQGLHGEASDLIRSSQVGPTTAGLEQYMNPYQDLVTDNIVRELGRRNSIDALNDSAQAAKVGAFGGSRTGIVESERARNHERMIADVIAQQNQNNYNQALSQFNTQQQLGLQGASAMGSQAGLGAELGGALASMGLAERGIQLDDAQNLLGIGGLQQAQGQQSLDTAFEDYWRQVMWPYQQNEFAANILQGNPGATQNLTRTTSSSQPGPSIAQQAGGLALGVGGLLKDTGAFGDNGWLSNISLGDTFNSIGGGISDAASFIGGLF